MLKQRIGVLLGFALVLIGCASTSDEPDDGDDAEDEEVGTATDPLTTYRQFQLSVQCSASTPAPGPFCRVRGYDGGTVLSQGICFFGRRNVTISCYARP